MSSSVRRQCSNSPDSFCYICGEYTTKSQRKNITEFVKQVYLAYFKVKLGGQDEPWAPHKVCKTCVEALRLWKNGKKRSLKFGVPMVWREPQNHHDNCYFCAVKLTGFNRHKKRKWEYPDMESARRPVLHTEGIPVPVFESLPLLEGSDSEEPHAMKCIETNGSSCDEYAESSSSNSFSQGELSDLIRDLNLSKQASELLASRLKEKSCVDSSVKIMLYRNREKDLLPFSNHVQNLVYCTDISGLLCKMGVRKYKPNDWRIFIDSSTRSLKCVLLHNGNRYASLPIAHSTKLKEEYDNIKRH